MKYCTFSKLTFKIIAFFLLAIFSLGISGCPNQRPTNYTIDDLISGLDQETWITDAWQKPNGALVYLDYSPINASNNWTRRYLTARSLLRNSNYRNKSRLFSTNVDWSKTTTYSFDWNRYWDRSGGRKGDLIFNRGTGKGAEVIKRISHWTHVAFANGKWFVFESMPNGGVNVNDTRNSWGTSLTHYTCRRMKRVSFSDASRVVDWGINAYGHKPYMPNLAIASFSRIYFVYKWSDKNDTDSMYCSKLLYLCYKKNPYIQVDLDSGITGCFSNDYLVERERSWMASFYNWVGVSPDDIYYSDDLGADFCYQI